MVLLLSVAGLYVFGGAVYNYKVSQQVGLPHRDFCTYATRASYWNASFLWSSRGSLRCSTACPVAACVRRKASRSDAYLWTHATVQQLVLRPDSQSHSSERGVGLRVATAGVGLGGMVVDGIGFTVQKATGKTSGYETIGKASEQTELLE